MSRHMRSDQDQRLYRTYDGRIVTRQAIDAVLRDIDARTRRWERLQRARVWVVVGILLLILVVASIALIWWRSSLAM